MSVAHFPAKEGWMCSNVRLLGHSTSVYSSHKRLKAVCAAMESDKSRDAHEEAFGHERKRPALWGRAEVGPWKSPGASGPGCVSPAKACRE